MGRRINLTVCIFIYLLRGSAACNLDQEGFQATSVCQAMMCEGRYVAIASDNATSGGTVTCICDVSIRLADSALIRYQSPGYPNCGIYYDWNRWEFSCRDGAVSLTERSSRLIFHKTVTANNPKSRFRLSIDLMYEDGSVAVQCYPPISTTKFPIPTTEISPSSTIKPTTSTTVTSSSTWEQPPTSSALSSKSSSLFNTQTSTPSSTADTPYLSTVASTQVRTPTTLTLSHTSSAATLSSGPTKTNTNKATTTPRRPSVEATSASSVRNTSTHSPTETPVTTEPSTSASSFSTTSSNHSLDSTTSPMPTISTLSFSSNVSSSSTVTQYSTTMSDTQATATKPPTLPAVLSSTSVSSSEDSHQSATSVESSTATDTPGTGKITGDGDTSSDVTRKVLLISIFGGVAGMTLLVIAVLICVAIRRRRMKEATIPSAQDSYIDAYDDTIEDNGNISNIFVTSEYTPGSNIPHLIAGDDPSYSPSVHSVSSGSVAPTYQWGSAEGTEAETEVSATSVQFWEVDVDGEHDLQDGIQYAEEPVSSDIYAIVTRKGAGVKFENHMSSLLSFKHT